jgi:hypothetical protein
VKTALAECSLLVMGCIWLGVSDRLIWSSVLAVGRLRCHE